MKGLLVFSSYLLVIASWTVPASEATKDYSGHVVLRVTPENLSQLKWLSAQSALWNFWSVPARINQDVDIQLSPDEHQKAVEAFGEKGLKYQIFIKDVGAMQKALEQQIALRKVAHNSKAYDFENYHPYEEIMSYLAELEASNALVKSKSIGTSLEGRDIIQVTIGSGGINKPVLLFDCNVHAREWVTAASCTWMIQELATQYGLDAEITRLVDKYDWKFVPVGNPDGYVYTWTDDRLWRKNRRVVSNSTCLGVDINRNFAAGYGDEEGSSSDPCDIFYRGTAPFSEPESTALKNAAVVEGSNVKAVVSLHAYDQIWISAYGYQSSKPIDYNEMVRVMAPSVTAIRDTYGSNYTYGTFYDLLYIGSGVTSDYFYEDLNITHSYTIEVRDQGQYGFILPADQILPTATEVFNGLLAMASAL